LLAFCLFALQAAENAAEGTDKSIERFVWWQAGLTE
jgi:hypothetical protein